MTEPTDADRAKAAKVALLREQVVEPMTWGETLDGGRLGVAAAAALLDRYVAAERAGAVADLRARVEAVAEALANDPDREGDNGGWSDGFTAGMLHASKRVRAAVTDTTGDPA